MESRVPAPTDGMVAEILTKPGAQVEAGTAFVVLSPAIETDRRRLWAGIPQGRTGGHRRPPARSRQPTPGKEHRCRPPLSPGSDGLRPHRRGRPPRGLDRPAPPGGGRGGGRGDRRPARRRRPAAARRQAGGGQGQHRRRRTADHRRLPGVRLPRRRPTPPSSPACAPRAPWSSAPRTSTSSRPAWSAPAARTARCATPCDPARISGGSSSGSAVAVALGIVDLALGTDTAGSGRVPAAFNGIVGLKPTRGLVPTTGVVPACASLDCVTVFARTLPEAEQALAFMASPSGRELPDSPGGPPARGGSPSRDGGSSASWTRAGRRRSRPPSTGSSPRGPSSAPSTSPRSPRRPRCCTRARSSPSATPPSGASSTDHEDGAGLDPTVAGIITRARDIPAHQLYADQDRLAALRARALSPTRRRGRPAAADRARPPDPRRGRRRPAGRQRPARPLHQLHQPLRPGGGRRPRGRRWTGCRSASC